MMKTEEAAAAEHGPALEAHSHAVFQRWGFAEVSKKKLCCRGSDVKLPRLGA